MCNACVQPLLLSLVSSETSSHYLDHACTEFMILFSRSLRVRDYRRSPPGLVPMYYKSWLRPVTADTAVFLRTALALLLEPWHLLEVTGISILLGFVVPASAVHTRIRTPLILK